MVSLHPYHFYPRPNFISSYSFLDPEINYLLILTHTHTFFACAGSLWLCTGKWGTLSGYGVLASLIAERGAWLSSCSTQAWLPRGMWNLPG